MTTSRNFFARLVLIAAPLLLTACSRTSPPEPVPTPLPIVSTPTPTPKPATPSPLEMKERERTRKNALVEAAKWGDLEKVRELLAQGYHADKPATWGGTPLNSVIWGNYLAREPKKLEERAAIVRLLIRHGANPNRKILDYSRENRRVSPLHHALTGGYEGPANRGIVLALLRAGANPNERFEGGGTPLGTFAAHDNAPLNTQILRDLLRHGSRLEQRDENGKTPLFLLASNGETNAVKFLIGRGARVNARDKRQRTPLHAAVLGEHYGQQTPRIDAMRVLLQNGANPDARDHLGQSPLHLAVAADYSAGDFPSPRFMASQLLLNNGANPNAKDKTSRAPLMYAIEWSLMVTEDGNNKLTGEGGATIWLLLGKGANANYRTPNGESALQLARKYNAPELETIFRRAGATR